MLSAMTGWEIDGFELMKIGERVINLQRMFNMREGFDREDDMIHERMKKLPAFGIYKDESRCGISDYEAMLDEYYDARGWDKKTGKPLKEKLAELEIE
jgi:aldehyde:ferredoxin oxidoreductase